MNSSAPIQPTVSPVDDSRSCPACGRVDAKAGVVWGCAACKTNFEAGYRWWDILGAGGCHGDDE